MSEALAPRRMLFLALLIAVPVGQLLIRDVASTVKTSTTAATQSSAITYSYDDAGRLVQTDYGGGVRATYAYDDAGNLLRVAVSQPGRSTPVATETPGSAAAQGGGCALRG